MSYCQSANQDKVAAVLVLEDSTVFYGTAMGAIDTVLFTCGELVFNTSMTGYQEIISDPSYCEQIIMFTQPHIGNVGVNSHDNEFNIFKKIYSKGIVIKSMSLLASNWRSENTLNHYLKVNNLIGIADIDTRELTNILRHKGSQRSCIYILNNQNTVEAIQQALDLISSSRSLLNLDLAKEVSTKQLYYWHDKTHDLVNKNVVVYDFGVKQQILKLLADRGCKVTVVPAEFGVDDLIALKPDGVVLSNGPGDPAACDYAIKNTKKIISLGIPIFGICLGFQILGLALGAATKKMKFGHHGGNHPVKDLINNKVLITSQNHGFMVDENTISNDVVVTHKSLFDGTVQGLKHNALPIIGFQGHPEASPGPHDIEYLFDEFIHNMDVYKLSVHQKCIENKQDGYNYA